MFCLDRSRVARTLAHTLIQHYVKQTVRDDKWCQKTTYGLYVVSDILYNSHSSTMGASHYRQQLEYELPDLFETIFDAHTLKKASPEALVLLTEKGKKVLEAWKRWSVFSTMTLRGFEMNLVGFPETGEAVDAEAQWESLDLAALERAVRLLSVY